jgi:hypothetical protein
MKSRSSSARQYGFRSRTLVSTWLASALWLMGFVTSADAQERDVAGAAEAFSKAQQAELRGDYQDASRLYGEADELAPAAEALRSAARTAQLAGLNATAATHAETLLSREQDAASRTLAEDILRSTAPQLTHLHVTCDAPCKVLIDGRMTVSRRGQDHALYARPGDRGVSASFDTGSTAPQTLTLTAGGALDVAFNAPAPAARALVAAVDTTPEQQPSRHKLSPWYLGSAGVLTLVAGGLTVWSGMKVISKHDDYDRSSATAKADYDDGRKLEKQTNALIGVTSAFAVATVALAFFTDFKRKGSSDKEPAPAGGSLTMNATRQGAVVGFKSSF